MLVFAEAVLTAVSLGEAAVVISLAAGVLLTISTVDVMAERALVDDCRRFPTALRGLANVARVAQRAERYSCLFDFFLSSINLLILNFLLLICPYIFTFTFYSLRLFFFDFFILGGLCWLYLNGSSGLRLYLVIVLSVDNYRCIFTVNVPVPISHAVEALACLASLALNMLLVLVILFQNCTTARSNAPNTLRIAQDHSILQ